MFVYHMLAETMRPSLGSFHFGMPLHYYPEVLFLGFTIFPPHILFVTPIDPGPPHSDIGGGEREIQRRDRLVHDQSSTGDRAVKMTATIARKLYKTTEASLG